MNKFIITIVISFLWITILNAQVYAGPDWSICSGQKAQLEAIVSGSCCVEWMPAETLSDPYVIMPVAEPKTTTTYTLTAYDDNGGVIGTDEVTVTVFTSVTLEVEQKKCCYTLGDRIDIANDFVVTTTPENFPGEIRWKADPNINNTKVEGFVGPSGEATSTIKFQAVCVTQFGEEIIGEKEVTVTRVKTTKQDINKLSLDFAKFKNFLKEFQFGRAGCEIVPTIGGELKWGSYKLCCADTPDDCIRKGQIIDIPTVNGKLRLDCSFPFPPAPQALDVIFGGEFKINIAPLKFKGSCVETEFKGCTNGTASFKANLGLRNNSLELNDVELFQLSIAGFVKSGNVLELKICNNDKGIDFCDELCVEVGAEFTVKVASLLNYKREWIFAKPCL